MVIILNVLAVLLSLVGTALNLWAGWGLWKRLDPEDYKGKPVLFSVSTVPDYMEDQNKFLGKSVIGTALLLLSNFLLLGAQFL